mmetsp:Transcript_9719/g.17121  ORF Transcript_9719/g.17121 Transcript_9719/m.17121 type:complete len:201 (-) Transcript_9719:934-1536(-)
MEFSDVGPEKGLHTRLTQQTFDVKHKLTAFFIRNSRKRIFRIIVTDVRKKRRVGIIQAVPISHLFHHGVVACIVVNLGEVESVDILQYLSFHEDVHAFIDPKVIPVLTSNIIAEPRMCNLVDSNGQHGLVSWKKGMRDLIGVNVFHASPRKGRWHYHNTVVSPDIGCQIGFSGIQDGGQIFKFFDSRLQVRFFGQDLDTV